VFSDSHCHLDLLITTFKTNKAAQLEALLSQCAKDGIKRLLIPATSGQVQADFLRLLDSLYQHNRELPKLYQSFGFHPWFLPRDVNSPFNQNTHIYSWLHSAFMQFSSQKPAISLVAIGECGLDKSFAKKQSQPDQHWQNQVKMFEAHCQLAETLQLPIIIHSVKAHGDCLAIIKDFPKLRGVVHGFSGSREQALEWQDKGFLLGIGGTITYERAKKTREALAALSDSAYLIETDAPAMPLAGKQGQANSPLNLIEIAKVAAQLRNTSLEHIALHSEQNFKQLFLNNA